MVTKLILIFIAGFIVDVLITKHTRYVALKKTAGATILSGMITLVNFALLTVILKESAGSDFTSILAFAGGNSLGTFMALKRG